MDTTPANIRKLQNVIEQSVILSESGVLAVDESWFAAQPPASDTPRVSLNKRILDQEREMIESALTEANGRVSGAAGAAAKLGTPSLAWNRKSKLSAPAKQNARRLDSHCHGPR